MRPSPLSETITLLVAYALLAPSSLFAQQTRPRRVETNSQQTTTTTIVNADTSAETINARLEAEPDIRIGLATDARTVAVSTSGQLLSATDFNATPAQPLAVARVRIEARALTPLPPSPSFENFRVVISGAATRDDAERAAREIKDATGEQSEINLDAATNTWSVSVGKSRARDEAEELRAHLEDAGFPSAVVIEARTTQTNARALPSAARSNTSASANSNATAINSNRNSVARSSGTARSVTRTSSPSRELIAFGAGATKLFSSRAPVTFASGNEQSAPVRFNEKPYRGRLEVFANSRGTLTVVNVVGLEDYVRGVVPNELSPGSYPAIEALKAQAVAARTYAIKNRGNFASLGFDLLPTTRSQVYGGISTEQLLSTRAVDETRGVVATFQGEPINALYTSTCGGRTENAENIFNDAAPYLRGRECALESRNAFAPFTIKTSREGADIREEQNLAVVRDAGILAVNDFKFSSNRITDAWLSSPAPVAEIRAWLASAAHLARQPAPATLASDDVTRSPAFSSALALAVYGESRADTLLNSADADYLLAFRDAGDIPARNRADVAMMLRDGFLSLYPDATLRPREAISRARAIHAVASILEARGLLQLQKATTRPTVGGALILRSTRNRDQTITVSDDAYLFRAFGENLYQMRSVILVGGEPVTFHVNSRGEADYMEVRPAPNGAAADHSSPFANWTVELTTNQAQSRLARFIGTAGTLTDLRVAARGSSRRAVDLEIVGANGAAHLRGGRIRSALGLREQLFVIDRRYDSSGRVAGFIFTGRGWGHGVGLCQVGAYGLARQGLTFDKILKIYYTGIELTKLY